MLLDPPSQWPNDKLELCIWRYFAYGPVAYFVSAFCWVGVGWIWFREFTSLSHLSFSAHDPNYHSYFMGLAFIGILASCYAQLIDAMREFITRIRADQIKSPLDELIPPQGRLHHIARKAWVLSILLMFGSLIFSLLWPAIMAPVI